MNAAAHNLRQAYHNFPPAFDESPWSYGFALFALILMAAISLHQVVHHVRAMNPHRDGYAAPVTLWRLILISIFSAFTLVTFPDVVVLLLWNEVTDSTMQGLWAMDRVFDGLTLVPFSFAVFLLIRAEERIAGQLATWTVQADLWPTWEQTVDQAKIFGLVAILAAGVSLGKLAG